jgi:glycosyltransferase involved in cell wall biosynthesis
VDAIAHLVRHQHEGLLSPPRDVAALSRHIIALLGDATLRTRMAAAARLRAAEYAAADGAAALEAVYRELTDG